MLGVFGDPEQTGKPAGDDIREGKRTALVAAAYERATAQQAANLDVSLGSREIGEEQLADVRNIIAATGALDVVEKLIATRIDEALSILDTDLIAEEAVTTFAELASAATDRVG